MMDVLTPLAKLERVSRKVNPATFVATPGIWAAVAADGSLANVATGVEAKVNKLVMSSASSNKYESHDIEVGRITTLESIGARVKVDADGYDGTVNLGDLLVVSSADGTEGKLVSAAETAETGDFEHVARCEEVNATQGWIIFRTISPYIATLS